MRHSLRSSRQERPGQDEALRVIMLSQLPSVGIEGLGHVLSKRASCPGLLADLFGEHFRTAGAELGLPEDALEHLRSARKPIEQQARAVLDLLEAANGVVLWPGRTDYPAALADQEGKGLPPLLFCLGDLTLLTRPKAAVVNSHKTGRLEATSRWVEITLALFEQLGHRGYVLLTSGALRHYNLPRFKALKDEASCIHVLDTDLLHWHQPESSEQRGLVVTAVPPQRGPQPRAERMQLRDRLLLALADLTVAVEVRKGGVMEREGLAALKRGRRIAVARLAPYDSATEGNRTLLHNGAEAFTPDPTGESLDRALAGPAASPLRTAEDTIARRQRLGQFFTPPEVASLMWDMVETMLPRERARRESVLAIDPAAGEGVFLRIALDRGWPADHLIGADLDEALQPAWDELFPNHREIGLHVANGLLDHPWLGIVPEGFDVVIGNPPFGGEGLRCLDLLMTPPRDEHAFQQHALFANPRVREPELDSFEAKREVLRKQRPALEQIACAVVRGYESWKLSRVTAAEIEGDSEADGEEDPANDTLPGMTVDRGVSRTRQIAEDFNIEQLIFRSGAPLSSKEVTVLKRLVTFPIEVLFAERFLQLCKPGGLIAVILPDGILASAKTQPFRNWTLERAELKAVISLPQDLFTGVGARAKTCIVLMRKYTTSERREVVRLKEGSGAPCVLSRKLSNHRVLMTSQAFATEEVPLTEYLDRVRRALQEIAHKKGTR